MQKSRLMKPKLNIHTSWKTQAMNISLLINFASSWIWQLGLQKASLMITKLLCFFLSCILVPYFASLFMSAMVLFGGGPFTGMKTKWLSKLPPFVLIILHYHVLPIVKYHIFEAWHFCRKKDDYSEMFKTTNSYLNLPIYRMSCQKLLMFCILKKNSYISGYI